MVLVLRQKSDDEQEKREAHRVSFIDTSVEEQRT
jgi:hypothetical protein